MWIYLKYLLFPFSIIYGFITSLRNFLYDYNILESKKYNVKIISIGNLVMGGSGKTPMVEYVSRYFIKKNYKFSIISRGYKRLTKGLRLINESDTYLTVGDEPKQLYNKFGNISKVIVSEDRHKAIKLIEKENNDIYAILDDAFQNRSINKYLDIVLSSYKLPFFDDNIFPVGMLRENKNNIKRCDVLIFTNSPKNISLKEVDYIKNKSFSFLKKDVPILFSSVNYLKPICLFNSKKITKDVVISTSVANSLSFNEYIESQFNVVEKFVFKDHHIYTKKEITKIIKSLNVSKTLITTEKDAVKLCEFKDMFSDYSVYYVPIEIEFLHNKELSKYI